MQAQRQSGSAQAPLAEHGGEVKGYEPTLIPKSYKQAVNLISCRWLRRARRWSSSAWAIAC